MIYQYDMNGNFIKAWNGPKEAAEFFNAPGSATNISACCNGRRKSFRGYIWKREMDTPAPAPVEENWKPIGLKDIEVSDLGRVRSKEKEYIPYVGKKHGKLLVSIYANRKQYNFLLAQLVAKLFVPNPDGCKKIDYKDGDLRNCRADNLIWTDKTASEAKRKYRTRKIARYSLSGEYIDTWNSVKEASEALHIKTISLAINGKHQKSAGGYIWKEI